MDDLSLETWTNISTSERKAIADRLARQLPAGFISQGLKKCTLGERIHEVAEFKRENATFVLIPGGIVTIGYDADRSWEPTPEELQSWNDFTKKYDVNWTIREHIARATLRPRKVSFRPFLLETTAYEFYWEPMSSEAPEVRGVLERFQKSSFAKKKTTQLTSFAPPGSTSAPEEAIRLLFDESGRTTAMKARSLTHADLCKEWATTGFRLPTSDEWEYVCGAGSPTLFRWGDHVPCDCYPIDSNSWDLHLRTNAFGLLIASNPYHGELAMEPGIWRGGDGGTMICGGAGFFLGWLTLATAYFESHASHYDASKPISAGYTIARRLFQL
jgi:hypothetical protein